MYGGITTAPSGYLFCNGASISTATYANLFDIIAYTYGGSGGNFSLPNLTSRFPIGSASTTSMGVSDSTQGGSTYITGGNTTMTANQLATHSHSISFNTSNYIGSTNSTANTTTGGSSERLVESNTNTFPTTTNNNSSNQSDFRPPYIVVQYIIKY
jgi:microcystin-dependent protein